MPIKTRKNQIFASIMVIATFLVAVVGATFAWFSTTISGTGASGQVTTATINNVQLTGSNITTAPNVLPGWTSTDGFIQVAVANLTGASTIPYKCNVSANTNTLPDLQFRIGTADAANSTAGTWTKISTQGSTAIVTGSLTSSNKTDKYFVAIKFPETASNQNTQQNKTVVVSFTCSLTSSTLYYNTSNPNGTGTVPNTPF